MSEYDEMTPEEYAALWGCDGSYDRAPNQPGDGALFYNFNVAGGWPIDQRIDFYERFLPAIERTAQSVADNPEYHSPSDVADLMRLHDEVHERLSHARMEAGIEPTNDMPYCSAGGMIDRWMNRLELPAGWRFKRANIDNATFVSDEGSITIPVMQAEAEIVARIEDFERRHEVTPA